MLTGSPEGEGGRGREERRGGRGGEGEGGEEGGRREERRGGEGEGGIWNKTVVGKGSHGFGRSLGQKGVLITFDVQPLQIKRDAFSHSRLLSYLTDQLR